MRTEKALFLDRDGVINVDHGYVHRQEDVVFVDGIFALCRAACDLGYRIIIVTNQAGIARGYYTVGVFEELMAWMRSEFKDAGIQIDAVYHCPYHPEHGVGEYKRDHEDRKPKPGMLLRAANDLELRLPACVMVGDNCSDVIAANAAGLRKVFLLSGEATTDCSGEFQAVSSLNEVARALMDLV